MEKLPFIPDLVYNRQADIHDRFEGNRQSGISSSSKFPYIFIFSGKTGKQHGYEDRWLGDDIFSYSGEGQLGDMQFTKGNKALHNHLIDQKRVFLFDILGRGLVKFVGELEYTNVGYFDTHDNLGKERVGIKFFFKRKGIVLPKQLEHLETKYAVADSSIPEIEQLLPNRTERRGLVTSRVGQGAYRMSILYRWDGKCAVTGFDKPEILIASHIVPWRDSNDIERLDVDNGILLSPTYDALFDRHIITFENSGEIILSENIESEAFRKIGVTGNEKIRNFKGFRDYNFEYLDKHRSVFHEIR